MSFDEYIYHVTYSSIKIEHLFHHSKKFLRDPEMQPLFRWLSPQIVIVLPVLEHPVNGIIEHVLFVCGLIGALYFLQSVHVTVRISRLFLHSFLLLISIPLHCVLIFLTFIIFIILITEYFINCAIHLFLRFVFVIPLHILPVFFACCHKKPFWGRIPCLPRMDNGTLCPGI